MDGPILKEKISGKQLIGEVTRLDKSAPATPATDQNSEIFVKSGEAFRVRVNALDSEGSVTP